MIRSFTLRLAYFLFALLVIVAKSNAGAGTPATICGSSFQLNADPLNANETGVWTVTSGLGSFSNKFSPISSVTGLAQNDNILTWTVTNTITSSVVGYSVTVTNNRPTTATITGFSPSVTTKYICISFFPIKGNVPSAGTGAWSVLSGGGAMSNGNNSINTVTGLSPGDNLVQWIITNGICSSTATADIFYNKADAGSNQIVCSDTAALNAVDFGIGAGYSWTSANGSIDDASSSTTTITGLLNGNNLVQLSSIVVFPFSPFFSSCPSFTTITNNSVSTSDAGSNQTLCSNTTTLTGNAPASNQGTGIWNILSTSLGLNFAVQSFSGTTITNIPEGTSVLEWKISKGLCESASTVTITNNAPTTASISGTNQNICVDNTTLSGNIPTQGTGLWSKVSGSGNIFTPNLNTTSVTGILPGTTNTYMWSVSFPGCPASTSQITVIRQNPEIAVVKTKYFPVCNTNIVTITALNTTPGIGVWQIVSGSGTIANANNAVTNITFTGDGRIQLNWVVNISGCTSTFDTLTIDHNSVSSANAGINQTICFDNTILNAATPSKGTGTWVALNTVSGSILSPSLPNATVTGLNPDANVFQWLISSGFCSSMATVTITNNQPSTSVTIADQVLCTNQSFLQANNPLQGSGTWTLKSGSGSISGINAATTLGSNLGLGKNVFNWTINKNGCTSVDSLALFNNAPSIAQAGTSKIVCNNVINLIANTPAQGNGNWSVVSGAGTLSGSATASTTVIGLSYGVNVFQWAITTSGCSASTSLVTITNSKVTIPNAGADTCIVASASNLFLNGNPPLNVGEKVLWTPINPPQAINFTPIANSQMVTVTGPSLSSGYYQFSYTISDASNNCSATDIMVASIITPASSIAAQCLSMDVGVTSLGTNLLSGNTLQASRGEIGRWAVVTNPASGNLILNATTGGIAGLERGVHVFSYTISNTNYPSCSNSVNAVVAVITKANAGSDVCLAGLNSTTLIANPNNPINTAVGGIGTWTGLNIVTTGAVSSITGSASNLQNGVNAFSFIVYNSNYPSCQSVSNVQVTRMTLPNVGVDTFLVAPPISNKASLQLYANTVNSGVGETGLWSFANSNSPSASFSTASLPNSSVTGLSPGANALRWTISNPLSNVNCSLNSVLNVYVQSKANSGASKKILILNPTPSVPKVATLTGTNTIVTANGEYGQWSLVSTNAPQTPTSISGPGLSTVSLGNLRRGVSIFRWTMYNSNFPNNSKYTNYDSVQVTVMTKAIAGNDTCLKNVSNFNLGDTPTVPIRPASNERFGWTCNNPAVTLNATVSDGVNSVPGLQITNLPIGRTRFYLSITNTGSGAVDTDSVLLTNISNPYLGLDPQIYTNTYKLTPLQLPNTASGETFAWAKVSGNSVFSTTGITPTVVLNDFNNNIYSYTLFNPISIIAKPNCFFSDSINIRNGAPSTANARNDTTVCNSFVNLYATIPLQGNGFWSVLSGSGSIQNANAVITTATGLSQGTNVFLWTVTTSGGTPSTDLVTITNNSVTIPNAGADICTTVIGNGTTAIYLNGNAPNTSIGETGLWTTVSGTGIKQVSPIGNVSNVSVSGLASGFFRYNYTISDITNQCKIRDTVVVTIVPLASVNGINQCLTISAGSTLSTLLTSPNIFKSGEIGRWSIVSSADLPIPVLNSITGTVTGLRKGVSEFSFTVSNTNASGCINSNASNIKISVITKANAGADTCMPGLNTITLIGNRTNLINSTVGGVGTWIGSNIATTVQTTGSLGSPTASISNLQFGVNAFYFNVFNSNLPGCISRDTVLVTQMTKSSAGLDTFLLGSPASLVLHANNPSGIETAQWSVINSPLAVFLPTTPTIPNATVNGLGVGINRLQWKISNTANNLKTCASLDTIDIYVQTKANAGIIKKSVFRNANPSIALSTVLSPVGSLSTSNGEYGLWTLVSTNAPQSPVLSTVGTNLQLSNLKRGAFIFKWTIYNSNFPAVKNYFNSDNDTLTVMTKAIAGNDLCLSDTVNLTLGNRQTVPISPALNERFSWTSSDPSVIAPSSYNSSDSLPILQVSGLKLGITTFYLTITNTGTSAVDTSSMTVRKLTNPKLSGVYINPICDTTYQLNVAPAPNSIVGENFSWTRVNGHSKFSDSTSLNPIVSPLDTGNNKFRFSIFNKISKAKQTGKYCTLSDSIIVRNNQPYYATITGIAESCYTNNSLQGNDPKLQFPTATAKWSLVSQPAGNLNLSFDDDTKPTVVVSNMVSSGIYEFTYVISNLGCTYTVPSNFTTTRTSTLLASAGPDATICGANYVMNADSLKLGEIGQWQSGTSGYISPDQIGNPRATVTGISQTQFGTAFGFEWKISKGECHSFGSIINIRSFLNPSIANIGVAEIPICENDTISLTPVNSSILIGVPRWFIPAGKGSANFGNANTATGAAFAQNIAYGSNQLVYEITNGSCVPSRDTSNLDRYHRPTAVSLAGRDICGDTFLLNAPIPDFGVGQWIKISTITSQISNVDSAKTLVLNASSGRHFFEWKVTNGSCQVLNGVNYWVTQNPTVAKIFANDSTLCANSTLNLNATIPLIGSSSWNTLIGNPIFNSTSLSSIVAQINDLGEYKIRYSITNHYPTSDHKHDCISSDTISYSRVHPPSQAITTPDTSICYDNVVLKGNKPLPTETSFWTSNNNLPFTIFGGSNIQVKSLPAGESIFVYNISVPGCIPSETSVKVNSKGYPVANAGRDTLLCIDSYQLRASQPLFSAGGSGKWTKLNGTSGFNNDTLNTASVSGLVNGDNTLVWTNYYDNCPNTDDTLKVTNNRVAPVPQFKEESVYTSSIILSAVKPQNAVGRWWVLEGTSVLSDPLDPNATLSNLSKGENIVRWTLKSSGCDTGYADKKIIFNNLKIPVGFSPNKDDANQTFEILGLSDYPNLKLEVLNRWGKLVYKSDNYKNNWEGTNLNNEPLADDSYFYIIKVSAEEKPITGFVQIKR